MGQWIVLLYYALLALLTVFTYYILSVRWWSAFNMALLVVFVVIVVTAPAWVGDPIDVVPLFLITLLTVASPVFLFIYVVSQALQDMVGQTCKVL